MIARVRMMIRYISAILRKDKNTKELRNEYNISLIASNGVKQTYDPNENWARTKSENLLWQAYNSYQKRIIVNNNFSKLLVFGENTEFEKTLYEIVWGVVETKDKKQYIGELRVQPKSSNIVLMNPIQLSDSLSVKQAAKLLDRMFRIGYKMTNMKRIVAANSGEVLAKEDKFGYFKLRY